MKREACPKIELLDTTRRAFNSRQVRAGWRVPLSLRQVKMNPDSCYGYISVANTPSALFVIYEN